MPSQVPDDISPLEGVTPEPWEEHAIDRPGTENPEAWPEQTVEPATNPDPGPAEAPEGAVNPDLQPTDDPPPAQTPDPLPTEQPLAALTPDAPPVEVPVEAVNPEALPGDTPVEAVNPDVPLVEPPAPVAPQELGEWEEEAQRNTAAPVEPMEWVERESVRNIEDEERDVGRTPVPVQESVEWLGREQQLPEAPVVTVDVPSEYTDKSRLNFRGGPKYHQTFWVG